MSEDNRSYSDSAESYDLPSVRRPHRSHLDKPETSVDMDRRHSRRRRRGDERAVHEDNHTSNESRTHHRRRHTRVSSTVGHEDVSLDKPRDKDNSGRVRRRSSVSSTTRPHRESTSDKVRTTGSQQSERSRRKRSHKATRPISPNTSTDGESPKERSKAREKTASVDITRPSRSSSIREKSTRPSLARSSTSIRHSTRVSPLPTVKEEPKVQLHRPVQRSLSVFGNLFGPPRPSVPEEKVPCLTCMDDVVASKAPMLTCGHRMCYSCLKRIFTLSVSDPSHMPPKCCTDECIPLKHVQKLFDDRFKIRWNRKYHEYTTKNRVYCPAKGCGSWIPPKDITRDKDGGRKYGTCRKCKTQVCAACNGKRHKSKECPQDDSMQQFVDMAKDNGWQKCYNCSATVELREGCNHMTCRCTAQFCMICGGKWKTCNCPWFNYAAGNGGFLNHMNVYQVREEMDRGGEAFAQPQTHAEFLERRQEQEQQDEEFARRLQQGMNLGFGPPRDDFAGIGMAGMVGRFLDADFVQREMGILSGVDPVQHPAADATIRNTRGQTRVVGAAAAAAFRRPAQNPSTRQAPSTATRAAPRAVQQQPPGHWSRLPPPPPEDTTPRRSTTRNSRPDQSDEDTEDTEDTDDTVEEPPKKGPAVLAGLNRVSDTSRVNAWRQHVTGEPAITPL